MSSLQAYNCDILPTYVFYDSSFSELISKLNIHVSEEAIGEFRDDKDIIDYLYKSEICSVFNKDNIQQINFEKYNNIVQFFNNDVIKDCITIIKSKKLIPLFQNEQEHDNSTIIPIFFSYHLFFFTHLCIQDIISQNGNISENRKNVIKDAIESLL